MKAYYINLARRHDRRARMEALLQERGIVAERVEAVTPDDLTEEQIRRYTSARNLHSVSLPELSCSLSHRRALLRFMQTDNAFALIMEDDVELSARVQKVLNTVPAGCDILRLESFKKTQHTWVRPQSGFEEFTLHRVDSICYGTAAYVVSRRAAQALLDNLSALALPFDHVLCNPYRLPCSELSVLQLCPAVAWQMDSDTTGVHASDVQSAPKTAREKPFPLSLLHDLSAFWQREVRMGIPKTYHQLTGQTWRGIIPLHPD